MPKTTTRATAQPRSRPRPKDTKVPSEAAITELAHQLGYVTQAELQALGAYAPSSFESKRKHGELPAHVRFGGRYYYKLEAVREYFATLSREPVRASPASQL